MNDNRRAFTPLEEYVAAHVFLDSMDVPRKHGDLELTLVARIAEAYLVAAERTKEMMSNVKRQLD